MNRRVFLTRISVAIGAALTSKVMAQSNMAGMAMPDHDMGAMDMSGHEMSNMTTTSEPLLAGSALPKHLPLPDLKQLINTSSKPKEFVATLHARPVTLQLTDKVKTKFWAYNDQIPGPAIEVYEGDTVKITLQNDLPQATTIHWHGLPVPADQDGNPQDEVPSGSSRTYTFTLPVGCAGTYWYHPHGHENVAEQVFRGLAGVFIVKAKIDPLADIPSQNWLISDLKLADNGQIAPNTILDWINGREGQFTLINGAHQPQITIDSASRVRLWNACSGRYLNLSLRDADLYVIGSDGGLIEQPYKVDALLLTPGERAEILVVPKATTSCSLQALAYDRGKMGKVPAETTRDLALINMKASTLPQLPKQLRTLPQLGKPVAFKTLEYTEVMKTDGSVDFLINGKKHDLKRIDLVSKIDEVEEWTIFNNSHMDHNFHLHGTQFQIINYELKGKQRLPEYAALKDTINLKPYEIVRIKLTQNQQGLRMYHCHILEHETLGMMGQLNVI